MRDVEVAAASAIADKDKEDKEDAVKTLTTDLNFLRANYSEQVDTNFAIDEYIESDRELSSNQSILTDKDIIQEVLSNSADANSDKDDMEVSEVESVRKLLIKEVRRVIEMLEKFSVYSEFGEDIIKLVREVNSYIDRREQIMRKHSNTIDLFKKND